MWTQEDYDNAELIQEGVSYVFKKPDGSVKAMDRYLVNSYLPEHWLELYRMSKTIYQKREEGENTK